MGHNQRRPADNRYVRAPHLCLTWDERGALVCLSGTTGRASAMSAAIVGVLDRASLPIEPELLAHAARVPIALIRRLIDSDVLVPVTDGDTPESADTFRYWNNYELAVQRLTGRSGRRERYWDAPMPPPRKVVDGERIVLRPAHASDEPAFRTVLDRRRSARCFAHDPMSLDDMAALLTGAARVIQADEARGVSHRPYASGGGRYPLELYLVPLRVEGLAGDLYHFDPFTSELVRMDHARARELGAWVRAGLTLRADALEGPPAAVVMITSRFARTMWKYENVGLAIVYKDVGCLMQTLYLQTTALGLSGCAVGAGPERAIAAGLCVDPLEEGYVGAFLVGKPGEEADQRTALVPEDAD